MVLNAAVVVNRSTDVGQRKTPPDQIADKQPERTELAKCRQKLRRHRPRPVFIAAPHGTRTLRTIGRASGRERECQNVSLSVVAVALKTITTIIHTYYTN